MAVPFMKEPCLYTILTLMWTCFSASAALASQAQPVPLPENPSTMPQLEISGVGIGTLNYGNPNESSPFGTRARYRGGIDLSDSALFIGAAQRLYEGGGLGSFGFGLLTPEESNGGISNTLFVHQAFLDYQSESMEWLIGRSDNRAAHLVDFPTIREENLLTFTNPLNPFSAGQLPEESRYSNSASITLNQNLATFEELHVQHLIDSREMGATPSSLNSFGATFQYFCPPGMEALSRFVSLGAGFEHEFLDQPVSQGLNQIYGGGVVNLNESLTDRVDFRVQELVNFGSDLTQFRTLTDTFQAGYHALAASVRYLHSPFGKTGYQLALTGGYRGFFKIDQAGSWALAATAVKRLGEGFDLTGQYRTEWRDAALAAQYQGQAAEHIVELGFVLNFSLTLNQHLSPRRTPLNFQHQYIPD